MARRGDSMMVVALTLAGCVGADRAARQITRPESCAARRGLAPPAARGAGEGCATVSSSRMRSYLAVCLGVLLVGCADRMVTLRYQPDSRIQPVLGARQLTIFKFADRRGTEGDEEDPFRVGGVYGGYGNRLAKVMTVTPFQRTLNEALVTGFKARGVEATGAPNRELAFGVLFETPLALGGELRNFSTESRWSKSAHISGILRLYDRRGAVLVENRVSARDQGGLGAGVFASSEPLEELMNEALREFVRIVVMDPDLAAQIGAAQ